MLLPSSEASLTPWGRMHSLALLVFAMLFIHMECSQQVKCPLCLTICKRERIYSQDSTFCGGYSRHPAWGISPSEAVSRWLQLPHCLRLTGAKYSAAALLSGSSRNKKKIKKLRSINSNFDQQVDRQWINLFYNISKKWKQRFLCDLTAANGTEGRWNNNMKMANCKNTEFMLRQACQPDNIQTTFKMLIPWMGFGAIKAMLCWDIFLWLTR